MDYMLNPLICMIWCSQQAHAVRAGNSVLGLGDDLRGVFSRTEHPGIQTSARVNAALAAAWGRDRGLFRRGGTLYFWPSARRR